MALDSRFATGTDASHLPWFAGRLAEDLVRQTRMEMRLEARTRERLRLAPPELN